MTFQIYKQGDNYYRTRTEFKGQPDEVYYVELSDSMYPSTVDIPLETLIAYINEGKYTVGMHGLKKHIDLTTHWANPNA